MSMNAPYTPVPQASGYRSRFLNALNGNAQMMQIIGGDVDTQVTPDGQYITLKQTAQISTRFKLFCGFANGVASNCVSFGTAYKNGVTKPLANGKNVLDHNLDGTLSPRGKGWSTTQELPSGGWLDYKIAEHAGAWFMVAQPGKDDTPSEELYTLIPSGATPTPTADNVKEIITLGRFYSDCSGSVKITQYVDGDVWLGDTIADVDYHFKATVGSNDDGTPCVNVAKGLLFTVKDYVATEETLDAVEPVVASLTGWKITTPSSGKLVIRREKKDTCSSSSEFHWVLKMADATDYYACVIAEISRDDEAGSLEVEQCTLGDVYVPVTGEGGDIDYHFKVTVQSDNTLKITGGEAFSVSGFVATVLEVQAEPPIQGDAVGGWTVASPTTGKLCIKRVPDESCSSSCGGAYKWVLRIGTADEECACAIAKITVDSCEGGVTVDQCTLGDIYLPDESAGGYTLSPMMLSEDATYIYQMLGNYVYVGTSERTWDFVPARDSGGVDLPPVAKYPLTAYKLLSKAEDTEGDSGRAIAVADVKLPFYGTGCEGGGSSSVQWLSDPDWQDWLARRTIPSMASDVTYTSPYAETCLGAVTQQKVQMSYFSDVEPTTGEAEPIIYTTVKEVNETCSGKATYEET